MNAIVTERLAGEAQWLQADGDAVCVPPSRCNQKDPLADYELGRLSLLARGRDVDYRYIVSCFEDAAAGGYAVAQYELGMLYYKGTNVHPRDLPRALALFHLANDQVGAGETTGVCTTISQPQPQRNHATLFDCGSHAHTGLCSSPLGHQNDPHCPVDGRRGGPDSGGEGPLGGGKSGHGGPG